MPSTLHLYTLGFPFGKGETFLETELPYLLMAFERIRVFPMRRSDEGLRALPESAEVVSLDDLGRYSVSFAERIQFMRHEMIHPTFRKDFRNQWSQIGQLIRISKALTEYLSRASADIHYSYWSSDWATVLGMLRKKGILHNSISRAHGFDLYNERNPLGYQPYRWLQFSSGHLVKSISELGLQELRKQYPQGDIELARLGTNDFGIGPVPEDSNPLRIISCSAISSLKRVETIASAVKEMESPVHWTHVGDGPMKQRIAEIMGDDIGRHTLTGHIERSEIMELYSSKPFHLFLSTSSSEGIPVSMMEALSFGIPVWSSRVGAVQEIVSPEHGRLLGADITPEELARELDLVARDSSDLISQRSRCRSFWESEYHSEKNYASFADDLLELAK